MSLQREPGQRRALAGLAVPHETPNPSRRNESSGMEARPVQPMGHHGSGRRQEWVHDLVVGQSPWYDEPCEACGAVDLEPTACPEAQIGSFFGYSLVCQG